MDREATSLAAQERDARNQLVKTRLQCESLLRALGRDPSEARMTSQKQPDRATAIKPGLHGSDAYFASQLASSVQKQRVISASNVVDHGQPHVYEESRAFSASRWDA